VQQVSETTRKTGRKIGPAKKRTEEKRATAEKIIANDWRKSDEQIICR
jgi:hypothetical protein